MARRDDARGDPVPPEVMLDVDPRDGRGTRLEGGEGGVGRVAGDERCEAADLRAADAPAGAQDREMDSPVHETQLLGFRQQSC